MQNAEKQVLGAFLTVCILNSEFCIDAAGFFISLLKLRPYSRSLFVPITQPMNSTLPE
jgi:hypothetical protein